MQTENASDAEGIQGCVWPEPPTADPAGPLALCTSLTQSVAHRGHCPGLHVHAAAQVGQDHGKVRPPVPPLLIAAALQPGESKVNTPSAWEDLHPNLYQLSSASTADTKAGQERRAHPVMKAFPGASTPQKAGPREPGASPLTVDAAGIRPDISW